MTTIAQAKVETLKAEYRQNQRFRNARTPGSDKWTEVNNRQNEIVAEIASNEKKHNQRPIWN